MAGRIVWTSASDCRGHIAGRRVGWQSRVAPEGRMRPAGAQATKISVSNDGSTAIVSIPVTFRQCGGRKQITTPVGTTPWSPSPQIDTALLNAVVRAHRWRQMLESGEYASSAELAKA